MPKVGDKFIIEIGEVYSPQDDGSPSSSFNLYRIEGFNSLVFDDFGLEKMEPYPGEELEARIIDAYNQGLEAKRLIHVGNAYQEGLAAGKKEFHEYDYQNGLDTAWNAVKILLDRDDRKEYNFEFCGLTASEIIRQFPVDEVVARLKTQLNSTFLCAGDEVEIGGKKVVVTRVPEDDPGRFCYIDREGRTYANNAYEEFKKTGRHFPIADLLEQMEATDEGD